MWNSRYGKLVSNRLLIFTNEKTNYPRSVIPLSGPGSEKTICTKMDERSFELSGSHLHRSPYIIRCQSKAERDLWLEALALEQNEMFLQPTHKIVHVTAAQGAWKCVECNIINDMKSTICTKCASPETTFGAFSAPAPKKRKEIRWSEVIPPGVEECTTLSKPFGFKLHTTKKVYTFAVPTAKEREKWVRVIKSLWNSSKKTGGSPSLSPSVNPSTDEEIPELEDLVLSSKASSSTTTSTT